MIYKAGIVKGLFVIIIILFPILLQAQNINTYAGNGTSGGSGDGGSATAASIGAPDGCAFDAHGNFYFTTVGNEKIRKVNTSNIITTVAGTGTGGYNGDEIAATNAMLNTCTGIAIDKFDNIYITDAGNNRVRKINALTGMITTIAGGVTTGFGGDGGPSTAATLFNPQDICIDSFSNIYFSDENNQRIRKIDNAGKITTIAGSGVYGYSGDGGPATNAALKLVSGICIDNSGNIFLAQSGDYVVRKIDATGIITTIAGNGLPGNTGDGGPATSASLTVVRLAIDNSNNLYVSGLGGNVVRKIDASGIIHTVVGTGVAGFSGDGGPARNAQVSSTYGITIDTCGRLYIADKNNRRIRKVDFNPHCWPISVEEAKVESVFYIYPNPATDELHIDGAKHEQRYKVYDIVGSVMQQGALHEGNNIIPIGALPIGMYMVVVNDREGRKNVVRLIKQ